MTDSVIELLMQESDTVPEREVRLLPGELVIRSSARIEGYHEILSP
jgi:hypothetical protein